MGTPQLGHTVNEEKDQLHHFYRHIINKHQVSSLLEDGLEPVPKGTSVATLPDRMMDVNIPNEDSLEYGDVGEAKVSIRQQLASASICKPRRDRHAGDRVSLIHGELSRGGT